MFYRYRGISAWFRRHPQPRHLVWVLSVGLVAFLAHVHGDGYVLGCNALPHCRDWRRNAFAGSVWSMGWPLGSLRVCVCVCVFQEISEQTRGELWALTQRYSQTFTLLSRPIVPLQGKWRLTISRLREPGAGRGVSSYPSRSARSAARARSKAGIWSETASAAGVSALIAYPP